MKKILFVALGILLLAGLMLTGCVDECKNTFEDCNYSCGEGLLSKLCKEKCTYDYNQCKEISNK